MFLILNIWWKQNLHNDISLWGGPRVSVGEAGRSVEDHIHLLRPSPRNVSVGRLDGVRVSVLVHKGILLHLFIVHLLTVDNLSTRYKKKDRDASFIWAYFTQNELMVIVTKRYWHLLIFHQTVEGKMERKVA